MVTAALNNTVEPAHMLEPWLEVIAMVGALLEFTTIVIPLLVLTNGVGQAWVLVIKHVTRSPFDKDDVEKVDWLKPTLIPFTCHW